ncbi:aminotransferase class I/II-fold pyridoxal phosphate-dependent enzyme [Stappia sp. GBMRC 2046]|uniref:Aminotransferase class I/II-fold pyridoxal phosphate-dependent enzyme n=1 Tax=Stappia sediminis TaxID=2692190 RepID=A0A7X3LYA9_9HYPH|nr:PLP-dependent aminotransferase family protein [Stappia sediminis]MXN67344.1 aminotransferase class I/II-fold pyridoxal phosphate-dependent enzyme [Stappia sediminis]
MTIFSDFRERSDTKPTARSLERFLSERIRSGSLEAGTRLPPVREAAWQIGCAPGTVARAYQALTSRGLAHGEVGRGTFIGEAASSLGLPLTAARDACTAGMSVNSFLMEAPDALLEDALAQVAKRAGAGRISLSYQPEAGPLSDREAALPFLSRWCDALTPEDIVLTAGGQACLAAAFASLVAPGSGIACDALTYPGVISAAAVNDVRLYPVTMDRWGMIPEALEELCRRQSISLLAVMPSVQNPTGVAMPAERREAIAGIAARHGLTVIEDEVYGFLRPPAGESFSRLLPDSTVLVTSLAKCIAPALRVGYAAGPGPLVRRIAAAQNAMLLMISPLLTASAAHILKSEAFEKRILTLTDGVRKRAAYVAGAFANTDYDAMTGGLAWLKLPEAWEADVFASEAEALGVKVSPGRYFAVEARSAPNAVRLSLGAVSGEERFRKAIDTIAGLAAKPYATLPVTP